MDTNIVHANLLEDPKTGFLWLHNMSMEETYRVKTFEKTLDFAKFREIQAELVSLHAFGLCFASYDLITVKNKENLYSVLTPFKDTMGYGAIYASICEGFAFKSVYGFGSGMGGDDYVVAETVDGKWGMIKISRSGNIWFDYNGVSFAMPETMVPFEYDCMESVLLKSNAIFSVTSSLNTDKYYVDLTTPDNRDIKEIGVSLTAIIKARECEKRTDVIMRTEIDNRTDKTTITSKYMRKDSAEFGQKVRKKIDGWYQKEEHLTKAVDRIVRQREEIIELLESVKKVDTRRLIRYLDKSGFFYRPSAPNRHHNFPGGLAEHSLGTYRIVEQWNHLSPQERKKSELYGCFLHDIEVNCDILNEKMDADDMIIAAICHDLCKAEHYYFAGRRILSHQSDSELKNAHGSLSVKRLLKNGINESKCEEMLLAVRMHMHLYSRPRYSREAQRQQKARGSMLAIAVWSADKLDASRHPGGKLHRNL